MGKGHGAKGRAQRAWRKGLGAEGMAQRAGRKGQGAEGRAPSADLSIIGLWFTAQSSQAKGSSDLTDYSNFTKI